MYAFSGFSPMMAVYLVFWTHTNPAKFLNRTYTKKLQLSKRFLLPGDFYMLWNDML